MTKVTVDVQEDAPSTLTLQIDLGQSLLNPEDYWEIASLSGQTQTLALQPTFATLDERLSLLADGKIQQLRLVSWSLPADSLAAISNPLTPQMAVLSYEVNLPKSSSIQLSIDDALEIPWPCLLRVDLPRARLPVSRLLSENWRTSKPVSLTEEQASAEPLTATLVAAFSSVLSEAVWVVVGFQHIWPLGFDHILFVLGLFLVSTGAKSLLWQVSAFTLAHSLTLALTALGGLTVPAGIVEPLIALSIVYIGLEYLYPRKSSWLRFGVVFAFGLVHGLGFASALAELSLAAERPWAALLSFNIGIELGQLFVLGLAFLVVCLFLRRPWYSRFIAQPASVTISGVGMYWFLGRIISG